MTGVQTCALPIWTLANTIGQGLKETADEFGGNGTSLPMLIEYVKYGLPFK